MIFRVSQHSIFMRCLPGFNQNTSEPVNVSVWNKCSKLKWHGRKQIVMAASSPACSSVVVLQIKLEEEEIINEFNMQNAGVKKKHK